MYKVEPCTVGFQLRELFGWYLKHLVCGDDVVEFFNVAVTDNTQGVSGLTIWVGLRVVNVGKLEGSVVA